jgi:murein DD-endopeptidase MepM/ murein hydrolase activator NlpD
LRLNPKLIGTSLEVKGDQLKSVDNSFTANASKLKSLQETDTIGSETSKNVAQTMASIFEAERLKQISPGAAQQLRRVIENSQRMGSELSEATEKYGRPSFISLPTSASFVDKQAQTLAQTLTGLQNADQMDSYIKYRRNAVDGHTRTNTVPFPGQIATGFVAQPLSKEIRKFYADEIGKVMVQEFTARRTPSTSEIDVKFPQAETGPVAPPRSTPRSEPKPKDRPSLADLKKKAGG